MGKKNKFLSWFGFGKKEAEQSQQQTDDEASLANKKAEQAAAEEVERQRLAAEAKVQAEQVAAEEAERQRLAAQAKAQAEQVAAEEAERQRLAAQAKAQAEQVAAEEVERQRLAAEVKVQAEQVAAEEAERQRLATEAQAAAEEAERQRLAAEAKVQAEQVAAEEAERQRLATEAQAAAEEAERQRLAAEAKVQAEQAANEEAERQRLAAEAQAAAKEAERQRLAAEAKVQAEQAAAKEAERQRLAAEAKVQAEQAAAEEAERQRLAAEAKAQAEQVAAEEAERQRLAAEAKAQVEQDKPKKEGFFSRLKKGLLKTKVNLGSGIASIFKGKKIDDDLFEELETQLLTADLGVDTTMKLIDNLTDAANRKQLKDGDALYELMKQEMADMLKEAEKPLEIPHNKKPFVILMVGVNGVGKTTTIGKLAKQFQEQGKSVMLAAGDTFRAAAVEQLQVWGERNSIPVIAQHTGADSASVVFDAFQAAQARNVDVLIADTAGRLQNKDNLMQELEKIARVMKKLDPDAPHEVMLTIDAGTGQNAISQVNLFNQAVGLTGITLTKLDGTAKGGVIFAVADKFQVPIRYIGVGEGIDDLRTFKSEDFIEALFSNEDA
ncbi:Signal recognition particle receptor FtsY [Pseudoalteromonas sp. CIP111854]|uniref:Signal recognition particle receptor FtsY n=1 Tax=Pseudoalteromonas holothuriae TaxID=2963714 RepID=A0A9W4QWQ3_9GAMM|nr:signal recognition particle-docking protein FtsY [Pseudoalteromonas sp. CIP111854]CAH9056358.1 Signal recognition particle receptor FtsY [Pseudoalteromonas sp. CIP111854]